MRAFSHILPRMFAVDFELPLGGQVATAVVLAATPESAPEKAFQLCPEYLSEGRQGRVREVECAAIDWERGRALVIKRKVGKPKPRQMTEPLESRRRSDEEGCNLCQGQHV